MPSITAETTSGQVDLAIEERGEACGFCRDPFSETANSNACLQDQSPGRDSSLLMRE